MKAKKLSSISTNYAIPAVICLIIFAVLIQFIPFNEINFMFLKRWPYKFRGSGKTKILVVEVPRPKYAEGLFKTFKYFWQSVVTSETAAEHNISKHPQKEPDSENGKFLMVMFPLEYLFEVEPFISSDSMAFASDRDVRLFFLFPQPFNLNAFGSSDKFSKISSERLITSHYIVFSDSGARGVKATHVPSIKWNNADVIELRSFLKKLFRESFGNDSTVMTLIEPLPFDILMINDYPIDSEVVGRLKTVCEAMDTVFIIFYPANYKYSSYYGVYMYNPDSGKIEFNPTAPLSYLMGFHIWTCFSGVTPHAKWRWNSGLGALILVAALALLAFVMSRTGPLMTMGNWLLLCVFGELINLYLFRKEAAFIPNLAEMLFTLLIYIQLVAIFNTWGFIKNIEETVSSVVRNIPVFAKKTDFKNYCGELLQMLENVRGIELEGEGGCFETGVDKRDLRAVDLRLSGRRKVRLFLPWGTILSPAEREFIRQFINLMSEESALIKRRGSKGLIVNYFLKLEELAIALDTTLSYSDMLREVLEGFPMGAAIIDPIGRLVYTNSHFNHYLGIGKNEIANRVTVTEVFKNTIFESIIDEISEFLVSSNPAEKMNFYREVSDPKTKMIFEVLIIRFFKDGQYKGNGLVIFNLTPFKKGRKAFEIMSQQFEHELNTIQTSIEFALKMHVMNRQDEDEFIKIAFDSLARMKNAVVKLKELTVVREEVSREGLEFVKEPVFVRDVINSKEIQEIFPPNVRFIVEVSEDAKFFGNKRLFLIALKNLLENAVKYGEGKVRIGAKREGDKVIVEIEDNGPGIPPDKRAEVFEPFKRVGLEGETHNPKPGLGLGLSIVREIVEEILGGQIWVTDSESLGGAKFVIELPAKPLYEVFKPLRTS